MAALPFSLTSWLSRLRGRTLALGTLALVGVTVVLSTLAQVPTASMGVADFFVQVSANSAGFPGSTTSFRPGDFPQWNGSYLDPLLNVPQWKEHQIDFPTAQPYKSGQTKYPYGYKASYKVGNTWSNTEPANNALVQSVKFRYDPTSVIPAPPPASTVNFSGGGDGYEVLSFRGNVYVVNHHQGGNSIKCFDSVTGLVCPGWGGGKPILGFTSNQSIAAINRTTGELFYATMYQSKFGYECFNVLTATHCGFTPYSTSPSILTFNAQMALGVVNDRLYSLTNDGIVGCMDVNTKTLCLPPNSVRLPGVGYRGIRGGAVYGTLMFAFDGNSLLCFNGATNTKCSGNWPVNSIWPVGPMVLTDSSQNFKAVCVGYGACFTATGTPYTRSALEQGISTFNLGNDGYIRTLTYKQRLFAIDTSMLIQCLDLSTGNICNGFPKNVGYRPYTLTLDAERPDCLWTNSDSGAAYAFDAMTGGRCASGAAAPLTIEARPLSATLCVPSTHPTTWRSIVLSVPASGVVEAKIFDANTSALISTRQFAPGTTSLNISDISFASHSALRVELTLGTTGTGGVVAGDILWDGPSPQFCVQTNTASTTCAVSGDWSASSGLVGSTAPVYSTSITGKGLAYAAPLADYSVSSAVSSSDITTSPLVFKGRFDERAQTGDLWVTRIQSSTGKEMLDPATNQPLVLTKASQSGVIPSASSRRILTQLPDTTGAVGVTTAFRWAQLHASQQVLLNRNLGNVADTLGSKRVDYLRGSNADESPNATVPTGKFRKRSGPLGMVLGSGLTYVPKAALQNRSELAAPGYESFLLNPPRSTNMVFMAANDGMLHGFRVTDGGGSSATLSEQFAYLPRRLLGVMNRYSDSTAFQLYANPYFHDNTPMVNDLYRNGAWTTVLVSAFGRGAPGFAALDITRGDAVTESTTNLVIREFTDQDDADMGYIVSQPTVNETGYASQIVNVKRGGVVRPAVIVGNGIRSTNARAALFVVFLDATGGYEKLVLPGTTNGLSTPRVLDLNGDGIAETVYAGDLLGNVWRIDISNATASAMTSTRIYTAMAPIASAPLAKLYSPAGNCRNCTMVNVATGRPTVGPLMYDFSPGQNALYGLWDTLQSTPIATSSLVAHTTSYSNANVVLVSNQTVNYTSSSSSNKGWIYSLPNEQMVVANPVYRDNGVADFFTLSKPGLTGATCQAGAGWAYALLAATGNAPPRSFDTNNDGQVTSADLITVGSGGGISAAGVSTSSRNLGQIWALSNGSDAVKNLNPDDSHRAQGARVMVPQRLTWQEMDR